MNFIFEILNKRQVQTRSVLHQISVNRVQLGKAEVVSKRVVSEYSRCCAKTINFTESKKQFKEISEVMNNKYRVSHFITKNIEINYQTRPIPRKFVEECQSNSSIKGAGQCLNGKISKRTSEKQLKEFVLKTVPRQNSERKLIQKESITAIKPEKKCTNLIEFHIKSKAQEIRNYVAKRIMERNEKCRRRNRIRPWKGQEAKQVIQKRIVQSQTIS